MQGSDYAIALTAAARRLLLRAAVFLWTIFLSAIESITLVERRRVSVATALSPAAIALRTVLMAVRARERSAEACALRSLDCRARFFACLEFAIAIPWCGSKAVNYSRKREFLVNLLRAAAKVSVLTMLSRVAGLARDLLIARYFGAGSAMDAFTVAFRLPNLLRRLFAEGAFSQAFVPVFAEVKVREGPERTRALLSSVASALFWVLLATAAAGVVGAPVLVTLIAAGFRHGPAFGLATVLTRWMFPYILFMSLVACSAGVLNAYGRFSVPAFTPVLLNVSMIGLTLLFGRSLHPPVLVLALGVLLGGALQLAIQIPALRKIGMLPRIGGVRAAFADADVRRILRQMLPAVFAVSVAQLSLIINTNIASHLATGSNSWLYYADRLMELPTALLGVAIGTVFAGAVTSVSESPVPAP